MFTHNRYSHVIAITLIGVILFCGMRLFVPDVEAQQEDPDPTAEALPPVEATPIPQATPDTAPAAAPDFESTTYATESALQSVQSSQFRKAVTRYVESLEPNQGGIIWLAMLVTILIAFDFGNINSWRNLDILLLLAPSFILIDILRFESGLDDSTRFTLFGFVFLGLMLVSVVLLFRALLKAFRSSQDTWKPNLPLPALTFLLLFLLLANAFITLVRNPDDVGFYTSVGAYRMLTTGKLPYGDPMLQGGAAATYGPILYLSHVPFDLAIFQVKGQPDEQAFIRWIETNGQSRYDGPPGLVPKLTVIAYQYLAVIGLVFVGRRLSGKTAVGLGIACLYAGSAYVMGIGGQTHSITGMNFLSHIAPAALTIWAFALIDRPILSGILLAIAAGTLFYPAFFFPLWFGYYFWRKTGWREFAASFIVTAVVIGAMVLLFTQPNADGSVFGAIYESTVGHQEASGAYGSSTFSFWGTHPELAAFWQEPFIEGWYLLKPTFLIFLAFLIATFFMVRDKSITQFAFLTASIAIAVQLWKSHAGGTYVEWYYPFMLIGLLLPTEAVDQASASDIPATESVKGHDLNADI